MNEQNVYTLRIGGQAGQGVKSSGLTFSKVINRSGYYIYNYTEYPSLIRGGHNVMQINFSKDEVTGPSEETDLLLAFNQETIDRHAKELPFGSGILYDEKDRLDLSKVGKDLDIYPVPLAELAQEAGGKELLLNTVALGGVLALLNGNLELLKTALSEDFFDKPSDIIEANHKAAEAGYNFIKTNFPEKIKNILNPIETIFDPSPRVLLNGNDGVALGAIAGGLQFAAIYPMSPISNILHLLAIYQEKYGYVYKQPEDEISAIGMAIGASFAGARAMTATSGGGFCLMTEGYGLAGMTETPLVIVEGMRGGPATGLPTWSEQGDLRFVLHAHQGEFPRIVLAAGDPKEAFYLTMKAFNLADKYQTPVLLLIDKNICENDQNFKFFDTTSYKVERGKLVIQKVPDYKRYKLEEDGVSTRSIPGSSNFFIANSDEHTEYGFSAEEIEVRNSQFNKRMQKLETCQKQDMEKPEIYGPENADLTIVSWGSNKGSILQAIKNYPNVNYLHYTWLNPFPAQETLSLLQNAKHVLDIECNYTGQLAGIIREQTGFEIKDKLLKVDGRPFFVEEVERKINSTLKELKK